MRQAVLRETLCVDANHQLHINVPADMGDEFEVIVLSARAKSEKKLSDEDQFMLAAYSSVVDNNAEEDAVWGKYVRK